MNGKGQIIDLITLPAVLFSILIVFFVLALFVSRAYPTILHATEQENTEIGQNIAKMPTYLNLYVWGILIAIAINFFLVSFIIKAHPVFIGISLFMLIISLYIAGLFAEASQQVYEVNQTVFEHYSALSFIKGNIPTILLGIGAVSILITYMSWRKNVGGLEI